jgi:predicted amidohydrolase YtcJ
MSTDDRNGPDGKRRDLLKAGAAAGVAAVTGGWGTLATGTGGRHDDRGHRHKRHETLVLTNGRIYTMDRRNTVASSVTIKNGKFVQVGHGRHGDDDGARVINLHGRTVIPGLVEPHVHSVSLANRPGYHTILENTTTIREIQEALAARRRDVPSGQWITSMGGWHPNQWDVRRRPTLAELDAAVSDRPVFLYERFTGPAVTNSLGKKYFDAVDAGPLPHPAAVKINVAANGEIATGGFGVPTPATTALYVLRSLQTPEDKRRSALDMMAYSTSVGLTSHLDQVLFPTPGPLHPSQVLSNLDHYRMYDSLLQLHREGRTTIRMQLNFLHNQNDPALPELTERLRNQFQFFGDDMMMTGSIGEWAAPIGAGPVWFEAQRKVAAARWRNENSVQTLAQLQQVVEAYEAMEREFGIKGLRWMVHHVPFVTDDLLSRLQQIGCAVQMAGYRWVASGPSDTGVGAPFRQIVDHGIRVGLHGDGAHIAPLSPWPHLYYVTTGLNSFGAQVNAGQQLTRHEALRLFTRDNPWFMRMEDKIGTIEEGKLADLAVLNNDYFRVKDEDIKKLRSVLTVVDGRIVHDAGVLKSDGHGRHD